MRRVLLSRRGRGLAVTLSVLTLPLIPLFAGVKAGSGHTAVAAGVETTTTNIESADTMELSGLQKRFETVADRVSKSVVAISAACDPADAQDTVRSESMTTQRLERMLSRTTRTVGTGLVIDADGFILTNEHVVADCEQLWITTDDRKVYPAIVIGSDPRADLAVIKIPASNLTPVRFALGKPVRRGDWSIALGNPYGLATEGELAMSVGVISATDRTLEKLSRKENRLYSNLIQTTAQINPGNSGGPLFNLDGEVIGINTAVILPQKQTNGIGFALPVTRDLLEEVAQLKDGREVIYAYIGVTVDNPSSDDLQAAGMKTASGAIVQGIESKSPADGVGLKNRDIILSVNQTPVRDADHFVRTVGQLPIGKKNTITIQRKGRTQEIALTPTRRQVPSVAVNKSNQRLRWHGMTLAPVPANWTPKAGEEAVSGVYVAGLDDASIGTKLGLKQGSIIRSVAGKIVHSLADLQKIVDSTPADQLKFDTSDSTTVATVAGK